MAYSDVFVTAASPILTDLSCMTCSICCLLCVIVGSAALDLLFGNLSDLVSYLDKLKYVFSTAADHRSRGVQDACKEYGAHNSC